MPLGCAVLLAARTPHEDGNLPLVHFGWSIPLLDAARTPHGDGNSLKRVFTISLMLDAARTPHGDGNWAHQGSLTSLGRRNPHPSRGR